MCVYLMRGIAGQRVGWAVYHSGCQWSSPSLLLKLRSASILATVVECVYAAIVAAAGGARAKAVATAARSALPSSCGSSGSRVATTLDCKLSLHEPHGDRFMICRHLRCSRELTLQPAEEAIVDGHAAQKDVRSRTAATGHNILAYAGCFPSFTSNMCV